MYKHEHCTVRLIAVVKPPLRGLSSWCTVQYVIPELFSTPGPSVVVVVLKTPPSLHRLYDLQDILDTLMHSLPPQLSQFCPPQKRVL